MNVCIAIDSFKGSLTSAEVGEAARLGLKRVYPKSSVSVVSLADGGEGTVESVISAVGGKLVTTRVTGPLGKPINASYGVIPETKTAIIEIAAAAGLTLVPKSKRNPLYTTTFGVGELILHAIDGGCRKFIIGLGGSATNDGGAGMLAALGVDLLDKRGVPIKQGAIGLYDLAEIRTHRLPRVLERCRFTVASDVTNPLCGEMGCSEVFGPQKGAPKMTVADMDRALKRYAAMTKKINPKADSELAGAGAAGGLGYAFTAYLGAKIKSGVDTVTELIGLEEKIKAADIVITGEGRIDGQTAMGKAPVGVARLAKKHKKPVIAIAGAVGEDASLCHDEGISAIFPILSAPTTLNEAMKSDVAKANVEKTVEQIFKLIRASRAYFK